METHFGPPQRLERLEATAAGPRADPLNLGEDSLVQIWSMLGTRRHAAHGAKLHNLGEKPQFVTRRHVPARRGERVRFPLALF